MTVRKVAMLTAGGLAPCLSSAVGGLIERYTEIAPDVELIAYTDGYKGLLLGESITVTPEVRAGAATLHRFGGSPIGNSRVKLTNVADCVRRGLVAEGQNPLEVAANQLTRDGVDVLHTIGGDDTNTTAADLAAYLHEHDYELTVVGLPKTIDNDVFPIRQSLGAWTAAEQGSIFAQNIIAEHGANPRSLIIHEVMGRNCGWLTAATAVAYTAITATTVRKIRLTVQRRFRLPTGGMVRGMVCTGGRTATGGGLPTGRRAGAPRRCVGFSPESGRIQDSNSGGTCPLSLTPPWCPVSVRFGQ